MIVFDIETGPLPDEDLWPQWTPPPSPPQPGEFAPATVKLGNLRDEAKIKEKIEGARQQHAAAVEGYAAECKRLEEESWQEFKAGAALSALTGRVLAIGYRSEKATVIDHVDSFASEAPEMNSEGVLLFRFWSQYAKARAARRPLVGHNISGFDVPFLVRRSWLLGVDVPTTVFDGPQRYLDRIFVDTMKIWQCGNYRDQFVGLDRLGKCLGMGGKTEGVDGGDFAKLYFGTPDERAKSLEYLIRDVDLTWQVAKRLGIG